MIERLLLAHARIADHNSLALLTIGVDVIVTEEIVRRRRRRPSPSSATPTTRSRSRSAGVTLFRTQLIALVVGAVLITAFLLAFRYTNWGVAMRAQAENREAAALMGIRSSRVTATAWLVAGALAGVAVLFMATQDFSGAGLGRGTHAIAFDRVPGGDPRRPRLHRRAPSSAGWSSGSPRRCRRSTSRSSSPRAPSSS